MRYDESQGTRPWAGTAMVAVALLMSLPFGTLMIVGGDTLRGGLSIANGMLLLVSGMAIRQGRGWGAPRRPKSEVAGDRGRARSTP